MGAINGILMGVYAVVYYSIYTESMFFREGSCNR